MSGDQRQESLRDGRSADAEAEAIREAADLLARLLDSAVRIPGTNLYLGLDPLIGLIPGIGDALASLIGAAILVMAVRLRVPRVTLARMCLNLLLNGVVGAVPGMGDAFSVWFQSNRRNAALLRRASVVPRTANIVDWTFVISLLTGTLVLLVGAILAVLWLVMRLWDLMRLSLTL
ncbi:MAG: DUF4112 domain-containing protein [Nitrospirae bacterium]|nr:MAG: DUF4112 domain-containing protein [Nitrospirota bacterium]